MTRAANNDRDERARGAAEEIMHAEREKRAAKTARLRAARLAHEAQGASRAGKANQARPSAAANRNASCHCFGREQNRSRGEFLRHLARGAIHFRRTAVRL